MRLPFAFHTLRLAVRTAACASCLTAAAIDGLAAQRPITTGTSGQLIVPASDSEAAIWPRVSLSTAINRTLTNSPTYATAVGLVRTAKSAQRVAFGNYLPTFAASGLAAKSDQTFSTASATTGTGSPRVIRAYGAGVAMTLPIFTGGFRGAVRRETEALSYAAGAGLVLQRFANQFVATQGYLEVGRSHELIRVGESAVAVAAKSLSYARTMQQAGTVTPADVLQAQFALATAQRQLLAARDTLIISAAALGRLVGADGPVDVEPLANADPTPLAMSDSAILVAAMLDAPAVRQAEAQAGAFAASVGTAKALYWPWMTATADYNRSNNGALLGAPRNGWYYAVGFTWPLFTGWQRADSVVRTTVNAQVAAVVAKDTRRLSGAQAQQFLASLRLAEQSVTLALEEIRVTTENLRVMTVRYRAGVATILDLLTSQQFVIQASLDLVTARYSYLETRASLVALLGREL